MNRPEDFETFCTKKYLAADDSINKHCSRFISIGMFKAKIQFIKISFLLFCISFETK